MCVCVCVCVCVYCIWNSFHTKRSTTGYVHKLRNPIFENVYLKIYL